MAKKKLEETKKVGRPTKYLPEYNVQVLKLAILGATDKQIADFFDVAESTINLWKLNEPEFSESIKKGKMEADMNVASSLYQKAIGFKAKTQKAFKVRTTKNGEGSTEDVKVVTVEEAHPPDTTAAIFWLKNRKSDVWRDKQEFDHTTNGKDLPAVPITGMQIVDKPDEPST